MAGGTPIYGNTLTDLMAGKNAAQGLDYSRANAQDATGEARLEAFLRLQGQKYVTQAQQNALAADRAMKMAELVQQNNQFNTSEQNRLTQLDKIAASQLAVANASKGGVDPRVYQSIAEIQAANQAAQERHNYLTQLSQKRAAIKARQKEMMANRGALDFGDPNAGFWDRRVSPEWTDLETQLKDLDKSAAQMVDPRSGIGPVIDQTTGGYIIPPLTLIPIPGGYKGEPGTPNSSNPNTVIPQAQVPAMFQ